MRSGSSLLIALALIASCIESRLVPCGELSCPAGFVCTPGGCTLRDDAAACDGKQDGDPCTNAAIALGTCSGGACHAVDCGNAILDPGEICDDGNTERGDGCSADCRSTEVCGNGVVDPFEGEICDEGVPGLSRDGCTSVCSSEVPLWREPVLSAGSGTGPEMTYDEARARIVRFDGTATWEWDGAAWIRKLPARAPSARSGATVIYDPRIERVVLFGGRVAPSGASLSETWLWDGVTWTQATPAQSPPGRFNAQVAYDRARERIVLFGGRAHDFDARADTWEWDGVTWVERMGAAPPARHSGAMAYDVTRARTVLFGGVGVTSARPSDTWEWDGTSWINRTPTSAIEGQLFPALVYRAGIGVVLFAGFANGSSTDMRVWDGTSWTVTGTTPAMSFGAAAVDSLRDRIVFFNGATQEYDGATWSVRTPPLAPPNRLDPRLVFDARRGTVLLVHTGFNNPFDTWEWNGLQWIERPLDPGQKPPPRSAPAVAYDSARGRVAMFGGTQVVGGPRGDLWEWDGTRWELRTPATSPPARAFAGAAYDSARGRIVMFGGSDGASSLADTWEWDGTSWTQQLPGTSPPARSRAAMTYDPVRQRVVLFGGQDAALVLGDTWEWDGVNWVEVVPVASPSPRAGATLLYDPLRARSLLLRGSGLNDAWEWDGTAWKQMLSLIDPRPGGESHATFDPIRGQVVLYDGSILSTRRFESLPLIVERCLDASEDGDGDGRAGCEDPDCYGRCAPLSLPGDPITTTGPRCGDGACSSLEDYLICPADCPMP